MVASPMVAVAQLGERQTEDLKVPGSTPCLGNFGDACLLCIVSILAGDSRRGSGAQPPNYDSELHGTTTASCKVQLAMIELPTFSV